MTKKEFENRADNLLDKRGLFGKKHAAVSRFREDFKVYSWWFFDTDELQEELFSILENDEKLIECEILETNFQGKFTDYFIPNDFKGNKLFIKLIERLILSNGKGVGIGELLFPLLIKGYQFSNESDGTYGDGKKSELKNNGASLKPLPTGLTDKGLVDKLNKKYFNGKKPGARLESHFKKFLKEVVKPQDQFNGYFTELYPTLDVTKLVEDSSKVYDDKEAFIKVCGEFAIREYKKTDGWNNLTMINPKTLQVVNIFDPSNLNGLSLKFTPKFVRGKDTQAIPDGYVNLNIG